MIKISIEKAILSAQRTEPLRVDLEIRPGEFVVIYGKSGVGKTTLLRMIAGLLKPDLGTIEVNQATWFDHLRKINLPVQKRNLGFVFQEHALFPNMTVMENLLFASKRPRDHEYLQRLLTITQMQSLTDRRPATLSGGQQQRLAIIRALAGKPALLLLDEPFSSLDYALAAQLRTEFKALQKELNFTTILVSHEPEDIYSQPDQLIELKSGYAHQLQSAAKNIATEKNSLSGKVIKVYPFQSAFIIEIDINHERLKIPVDAAIAPTFKPGQKADISFAGRKIFLSSHEEPSI